MQPHEPFPDAVWKTWLSFLAYPKLPLEARTDLVDESPPDWRLEKVSFTAAYGGERMQAYLFIPRKVPPPWQAILFRPTAAAEWSSSSGNGRGLQNFRFAEHLVKDGRAVVYPILKGTYERGGGVPEVSVGGPELDIMQTKDISRSIDYLESRSDFDKGRIAYLGVSAGAMMGPLPCASDKRIRTGILLAGGMIDSNAAGWVARVRIPILMINGQFDYLDMERTQAPMFRLLATPAEDKRLIVYPTDHLLGGYEKEMITESLAWLDRYLGPVRKENNAHVEWRMVNAEIDRVIPDALRLPE